MNPNYQNQLRLATLMLRFRTTQPTPDSFKYLSYRVISHTLNLTHNEVQYICQKSLKTPKDFSKKDALPA